MARRSSLLVVACFCLFNSTGYATEPIDDSNMATSPFSASLAITSNYVDQGIIQSNKKPAIQGSATYLLPDVGFYGNVWASTVQFPDGFGGTAHEELVLALGASQTLGRFSYDIAMMRYNYPKTLGTSYSELVASFQLYWLTSLIGYSRNVIGSRREGTRYSLGVDYDIPPQYLFNINGMNLVVRAEHYALPPNIGLPAYNDYLIQLTKTINQYAISLGWTDTSGLPPQLEQFGGNNLALTLQVNF